MSVENIEQEIWEAIRKHSSPTVSREGKEGYVSMHGGQGGIILWERDGKPFVIAEIMKIIRRARSASSTPSLTNPNPKREDERVKAALEQAYDAGFQASGEGWNGEYPERDWQADPTYLKNRSEALAALSAASARPSPGDPVRAALEALVKSLDDLIADSEGVAGLHRNGDVATWEELISGGRFEDWLSSLDAARAALSVSTPTGEGEAPEIIQHVKSKGLYEVVTRDAQVQTDTPLSDYAFVCVYRNAITGATWVRPVSEMDDGRFVTVLPTASTSPSKSSGEEA